VGLACPECGGKVIVVGMTKCPRCDANLSIDPEAEEYETAERAVIVEDAKLTNANWSPAAKAALTSREDAQRKVTRDSPVEVDVGFGESVSATWGAESFTPKPYNAFHVGPYSGTTRVRSGETHARALARLEAELEAYAAEAYERKRREYLKRLNGLVRASAES